MYRSTESRTGANETEVARLIAGWADLFARHDPYDHFATFTFERGDVSEAEARRDFARQLARVESRLARPVAHAAVFAQSFAGHIHVHALLKGTGGVPVLALRESWPHGYSHSVRYDQALGARGYLARHIAKPGQRMLGDVEIASVSKFVRAAGRRVPRHRSLHYFTRGAGGVWYVLGRDALGKLRTFTRRSQ